MKIQFIASPSGRPWNLAYFAGDIVDMPDAQAAELVSANIAQPYTGITGAPTGPATHTAVSTGAAKAQKR